MDTQETAVETVESGEPSATGGTPTALPDHLLTQGVARGSVLGSVNPTQLKFPKCVGGNPKYQFAATDYCLKTETQLQQEKRSAKLQVHLTNNNLTDAQT